MRTVIAIAPAGALLLGLLLVACTGSKTESSRTETAVAEAAQPPVRNDALLLPATDQVSTSVVPQHILGEPKLPGGTMGEYESKGKKYQLFVVRTDGNQRAAILLLDLKNAMTGADYVPHMGGYAGKYKDAPLFAFAKLQFLAGVVGLPQKDADLIARQLAAKLH